MRRLWSGVEGNETKLVFQDTVANPNIVIVCLWPSTASFK